MCALSGVCSGYYKLPLHISTPQLKPHILIIRDTLRLEWGKTWPRPWVCFARLRIALATSLFIFLKQVSTIFFCLVAVVGMWKRHRDSDGHEHRWIGRRGSRSGVHQTCRAKSANTTGVLNPSVAWCIQIFIMPWAQLFTTRMVYSRKGFLTETTQWFVFNDFCC